MTQNSEPVLTVKEVAQRLRVSQATVLRLIDDGELTGVFRVGNQWRIPQSALDEYIRRSTR